MDRDLNAAPQWPHRLPAAWARVLAGLAIFALLIAVSGVFLYEGWHRVAFVVAFTTMGLGNLGLAAGSLLPDSRWSRVLRGAIVPLSLVMLVALGFSLAFQFGWLA